MHLSAITICLPGTYLTLPGTPTSNAMCATCSPGYYCPGVTAAPQLCSSPTQYSAMGYAQCANVSLGYYLTGTASNHTGQAICPIGSSCSSAVLTPCVQQLTYANTTGATQCTPCLSTCPAFTIQVQPCTVSSDRVCKDVAPPALTLNGPTYQVIEALSAPYFEYGWSALDAHDGNLTSMVTFTPLPNTSVPGFYNIAYTVTDLAGNLATANRTVLIQDTTAPNITLSGPLFYTSSLPAPYVDFGAVAFDKIDGNITAKIVVSGLQAVLAAVANHVPGNFSVQYSVSDAAGNRSPVLMRVVLVVDATPPVLSVTGGSPFHVEASKVRITYNDFGLHFTIIMYAL